MVLVTMQLNTLRCISQVDDPHSAPGLVKTINMLSGSSCRQLLPENVRAGTVVDIPVLLGKTKIVLNLDGLKPVAGLIVVVLEENETSDNLMRIGHQVFGQAVHDEINNVAKGGSANLTDEQKKALADRVQKRVIAAIEENAGAGEFFRRRDRLIGFASEVYDGPILQLLLDKAPGLPYPIQDRIRSQRTIQLPFPFPPVQAVDEYEISGSIQVSPFQPPGPDPCQAQIDALAAANGALEAIDGDILDLQEQVRLAPPAKKQEIRNKIRALQVQRRPLAGQRDQAFEALRQCRAQHPALSGFSVAES